MRIEDHFLGLTWISPDIWHPAVAQAHMCNLHGRRDTVDQNNFMAPIKLIGFARVKAEGYVCSSRRFLDLTRSIGRIPAHGVIAAIHCPAGHHKVMSRKG